MPAGRFDKRVEIQSATESRDAVGGVTRTWATDAKRWASVEDLGGREFFNAQQVNSDVTTRITLREQYAALTTSHRIVYGDRTFNVSAITGSSERTPKRGQEVMCTEATTPE